MLCLTILCFGCGYGSPKAPLRSLELFPPFTELSPDNANAGGPAFTLTVNGSSFATNAVVNWNGAPQTTTYVTGKQLMAAIPATAIATPGTVPVTVTNPGTPGSGGPYGGGGTASETSNAMNFTVK